MRCIGASTYEEYKNYFEKDRALSRRFQKIEVHETDIDETVAILKGLRSYYEDFHGVHYTESALRAAAELSAKYINDKFLPDKAIDVIDEAGARVRLRSMTAPVYGFLMSGWRTSPWPHGPTINFVYFLAKGLAYNNELKEACSLFKSVSIEAPGTLWAQLALFFLHAIQGEESKAIEIVTEDFINIIKDDEGFPIFDRSAAECSRKNFTHNEHAQKIAIGFAKKAFAEVDEKSRMARARAEVRTRTGPSRPRCSPRRES
jgi:hypothetical protein